MIKEINFEYLGKLDVSSLKDQLQKINNWDHYQFRQKNFEVHKLTKTIPLIFDEDFRTNNPSYLSNYDKYKKYIESFKDFLKNKFNRGFIIRAILVNLPANSKIPPHIDTGESLSKCRRIHIPIITNSEVYFTVGNERKNLKTGELWEINNAKKIHFVENNSNNDRVHLIIDWMNN